jgi:hypothetical protein
MLFTAIGIEWVAAIATATRQNTTKCVLTSVIAAFNSFLTRFEVGGNILIFAKIKSILRNNSAKILNLNS